MVGIMTSKRLIRIYASDIDFQDDEQLRIIKKTIEGYINDKEVKCQIDNYDIETFKLNSLKEFDIIMYMCHISYCHIFGKELKIEQKEPEVIQ